MSAPVMEAVSARTLVSEAFFDRLTRRVATKEGLPQEEAARRVEQALAYLATCAQKAAGAPSLAMSRAVDGSWHAFLEYSRPYDEFFASHGWPKVHHNPCDEAGVTYESAHVLLPRTVQAIEAAGYRVDRELWTAHVDCGDTCGDDGGGGNPPDCGHTV
jgi:hypothetical protein